MLRPNTTYSGSVLLVEKEKTENDVDSLSNLISVKLDVGGDVIGVPLSSPYLSAVQGGAGWNPGFHYTCAPGDRVSVITDQSGTPHLANFQTGTLPYGGGKQVIERPFSQGDNKEHHELPTGKLRDGAMALATNTSALVVTPHTISRPDSTKKSKTGDTARNYYQSLVRIGRGATKELDPSVVLHKSDSAGVLPFEGRSTPFLSGLVTYFSATTSIPPGLDRVSLYAGDLPVLEETSPSSRPFYSPSEATTDRLKMERGGLQKQPFVTNIRPALLYLNSDGDIGTPVLKVWAGQLQGFPTNGDLLIARLTHPRTRADIPVSVSAINYGGVPDFAGDITLQVIAIPVNKKPVTPGVYDLVISLDPTKDVQSSNPARKQTGFPSITVNRAVTIRGFAEGFRSEDYYSQLSLGNLYIPTDLAGVTLDNLIISVILKPGSEDFTSQALYLEYLDVNDTEVPTGGGPPQPKRKVGTWEEAKSIQVFLSSGSTIPLVGGVIRFVNENLNDQGDFISGARKQLAPDEAAEITRYVFCPKDPTPLSSMAVRINSNISLLLTPGGGLRAEIKSLQKGDLFSLYFGSATKQEKAQLEFNNSAPASLYAIEPRVLIMGGARPTTFRIEGRNIGPYAQVVFRQEKWVDKMGKETPINEISANTGEAYQDPIDLLSPEEAPEADEPVIVRFQKEDKQDVRGGRATLERVSDRVLYYTVYLDLFPQPEPYKNTGTYGVYLRVKRAGGPEPGKLDYIETPVKDNAGSPVKIKITQTNNTLDLGSTSLSSTYSPGDSCLHDEVSRVVSSGLPQVLFTCDVDTSGKINFRTPGLFINGVPVTPGGGDALGGSGGILAPATFVASRGNVGFGTYGGDLSLQAFGGGIFAYTDGALVLGHAAANVLVGRRSPQIEIVQVHQDHQTVRVGPLTFLPLVPGPGETAPVGATAGVTPADPSGVTYKALVETKINLNLPGGGTKMVYLRGELNLLFLRKAGNSGSGDSAESPIDGFWTIPLI